MNPTPKLVIDAISEAGSVRAAAKLLGVTRAKLRRLIDRYDRNGFSEDDREVLRPFTQAVRPSLKTPPDDISIFGVKAGEAPAFDDVFRRHAQAFENKRDEMTRKRQQVIEFPRGPICLVLIADTHFGNPGTDVVRAFREAELVRNTPGMYVALLGDEVDNFIVGKLRDLNMNNPLPVSDQDVLLHQYISVLGPKLLAWLIGNHLAWTYYQAGIDHWRGVAAQLAPDILYDRDEIQFTLKVGQFEQGVLLRHSFRGQSQYNVTHGIEKSQKWEQREGVTIFGQGHTHPEASVRTFTVGENEKALALHCGTYKIYDSYARKLGLPGKPRKSAAVAVIIDETRQSVQGFDNLDMAAAYMRSVYSG